MRIWPRTARATSVGFHFLAAIGLKRKHIVHRTVFLCSQMCKKTRQIHGHSHSTHVGKSVIFRLERQARGVLPPRKSVFSHHHGCTTWPLRGDDDGGGAAMAAAMAAQASLSAATAAAAADRETPICKNSLVRMERSVPKSIRPC